MNGFLNMSGFFEVQKNFFPLLGMRKIFLYGLYRRLFYAEVW